MLTLGDDTARTSYIQHGSWRQCWSRGPYHRFAAVSGGSRAKDRFVCPGPATTWGTAMTEKNDVGNDVHGLSSWSDLAATVAACSWSLGPGEEAIGV